MTTKVIIRPSSVSGFVNCSWQWYNTFILGKTTIPGARAAIGTGIHKAVEVMWSDAIHSGAVDSNLSKLNDAGVAAFNEEAAKGALAYDAGEDANSARVEIVKGISAFVSDILPFTDIPDAVETRLTVEVDHPVVSAVSGTLDYLKRSTKTLADVKTSKKTPVAANYDIQQSIYKILAEKNNIPIETNLIQGVVLTQKPKGTILELTPKVSMAKYLINNLLDALEAHYKGLVDPKVLFRGNPKYYLCDDRYCSLRATCPFAKGEA